MNKNVCLLLLLTLTLMLLCSCQFMQTEAPSAHTETQWPSSDVQIHTRKDFPLTHVAQSQSSQFPLLTYTHAALDDVYLYEIYNPQYTNAPLVIFLHEQGVSKDEYLELASSCAQAGYFCVLMDLPGHGERASAQAIQAIEAVITASAEVDLLLEYYRFSRYADSSRFGLYGVSMGGSVAYHYAAFGKKEPAVLLVCSAAADFTELHEKGSLLNGKELPSTWDKSTFQAFCEPHNPINNMEALQLTPIFAVYGNQDQIVSIPQIQALAEDLVPFGNARFMFIEHANHEVSNYMLPHVIPTLGQYLH